MEKHAAEIKALKLKHEDLIQELNNGFDNRIAQKESEHEANVRALTAAHDNEIKKHERTEESLRTQIAELQAKIASLEDEKKAVELKLSRVESQIQSYKDRVADAERTMMKSLEEHRARTKQIEEEYHEKETRLQQNLRRQME